MDANVSLSHTRAALSRVLGLQKSLVGGGLEGEDARDERSDAPGEDGGLFFVSPRPLPARTLPAWPRAPKVLTLSAPASSLLVAMKWPKAMALKRWPPPSAVRAAFVGSSAHARHSSPTSIEFEPTPVTRPLFCASSALPSAGGCKMEGPEECRRRVSALRSVVAGGEQGGRGARAGAIDLWGTCAGPGPRANTCPTHAFHVTWKVVTFRPPGHQGAGGWGGAGGRGGRGGGRGAARAHLLLEVDAVQQPDRHEHAPGRRARGCQRRTLTSKQP